MSSRERWFRAMAGGFGRKSRFPIMELIGLIALVLLLAVTFWQ